jgi:hypothetical protein
MQTFDISGAPTAVVTEPTGLPAVVASKRIGGKT